LIDGKKKMTELTKHPFTEEECRTVAALAEMVIPASEEHDVPGADDPAIVDNILKDASRRPGMLQAALAAVNTLARTQHGADFSDLTAGERETVTSAFRETHEGHANVVASLTVQGYYRDDRVMRSIGLDPRPPHPQGYEVEQGDWSLLNSVRQRDVFYRPVD
jgi:hypothetical protein